MTQFRGLLAGVLVVLTVGGVRADEPKAEAKKLDAAQLVGKWTIAEMTKYGEKVDTKEMKDPVVITKDKITVKTEVGEFVFAYTLDAKADPVVIDMDIVSEMFKGTKAKGILKLDGDKLMLAYDTNPEAKGPPAKFESPKESSVLSYVMTRAIGEKPAKDDK